MSLLFYLVYLFFLYFYYSNIAVEYKNYLEGWAQDVILKSRISETFISEKHCL